MYGADISGWQVGIPMGGLGDFVIVKATGGAGFVSAGWPTQLDQAMAAGKKVGMYHYAHEAGYQSSAEAEAQHFIAAAARYRGQAIPVLDWEGDNVADTGWAARWLQLVGEAFGTTPWIYMNASAANGHNWAGVAGRYPLWLAQYPNGGEAAGHTQLPQWGNPVAWQFTEKAIVPGWGKDIDYNVFYGSGADWDAHLTAGRRLLIPGIPDLYV